MGTRFEKHLMEEDIWKTNEHMKRCPKSLGKIQIKTTMRTTLHVFKWVK